jgi:predicted amidohydrolase
LKTTILTIATCQFDVRADVHANLAQIISQIKTAKSRHADVAHFPECCLTGYGGIHLQSIRKEDYNHLLPAVEKIKQLAAKLGIYVILGAHHFKEGLSKPRNSLYAINSEGRIEARYDKRILAGTDGTLDHLYYSAGEKPVTFQLNGIKCGLVICHEWRYAEFYREYKGLGAEVIFHSWFDGEFDEGTYKAEGKAEGELVLGAIKGYAANNYLWVSGSNVSTKQSCFSSFIARPDGKILNDAPRNKPYVLISQIDLNQRFIDPSFYGRQRFL